MVAGVLTYFRIVTPFNELVPFSRRLAQGDFRPVLLSSHQGLLQETYADVRRISESCSNSSISRLPRRVSV